jgi:hypothetical protein
MERRGLRPARSVGPAGLQVCATVGVSRGVVDVRCEMVVAREPVPAVLLR